MQDKIRLVSADDAVGFSKAVQFGGRSLLTE
jgi:hypothetical protein